MGKELVDTEIEKAEVKLNHVTDGDIATLNFVVNCIRQAESALKIHKTGFCNNRSGFYSHEGDGYPAKGSER